ncbi:MAG: trigger factor [Rhodospirillales bacterium]|nr:trigger factor [Rhodospirillales bacterium]
MQVVETKNEGLRREFKIAVPAQEIEEKIASRLNELAQTARLPGFRPGKVPVSLLRKRFGPSVVGEVLDATVTDASQRTMTERGLRPAGTPKVEITSYKAGGDLEYTFAVEVMPEITPVDYGALKLERLVVNVADADVEKTLARLAEQHKSATPVADARASRKGDVVLIDFVGRIDGAEFPGGKAEGYELELGSASFIPGFEDQLEGVKVGEARDVKVTFPEAYGAAELAGKEAVFEVKVKEIKATAPAQIDAALAKKLGFETLDALKTGIREQQQKEFKSLSRMRLKRLLLDRLADSTKFDVPQEMVENEFQSIWKQFGAQAEGAAPTEGDAAKADDAAGKEEEKKEGETEAEKKDVKSEEEQKAEFRSIAERRVRLGLVLSEVGRLNNIRLSQEDINRGMMEEARRHPGQEQKVLEYYRKTPEAVQSLTAPLYEDKVVDFIVEMASVSEKKVTIEELLRDPDQDEGETPAAEGESAKKKKTKAKKKAD